MINWVPNLCELRRRFGILGSTCQCAASDDICTEGGSDSASHTLELYRSVAGPVQEPSDWNNKEFCVSW